MSTSGDPNDGFPANDVLSFGVTQDDSMEPTKSFGSIDDQNSTAPLDSEKSLFEEDLVPVETLSYLSIDDKSGTAIENTVEAEEAGKANTGLPQAEEEGNGTDPKARVREPLVFQRKSNKGKTPESNLWNPDQTIKEE